MRWIPFFLGATALFGSVGCDGAGGIDTDPTIFVDITVEDPRVNVDNSNALGTAITGGFTMKLHLGARAAGSSDVALESFELTSQDENTVVVDSGELLLATNGQPLPVTVEPDSDEEVEIVIDLGSKLLEVETGQKLCNFGVVRYRGSISDSLKGTSLPVLTEPVTVTGCMAGP